MSVAEPLWLQLARAFRADDPDPDTRAELDALLARAAEPQVAADLRDRFETRLGFGTAGLRGLIGAGDNRMNQRVVAQTTAALCAQLAASVPNAAERGLCIGFDGRRKSRELAEEVRAVANGAGFVVHAFDAVVPTPLLAYAVRARAAAGGVMITASHNPAAYNGYKVYWEDGAQLNTPHDAEIAGRIQASPAALALPRQTHAQALAQGRLHALTGTFEAYLRDLEQELGPAPAVRALPRIAYTALHGVGEPFARAALARAGVTQLDSVAEQAQPDPNFPTVRFPNPEEPGALDRVMALAAHTQAQLVLANDPDADRLAAAVVTPSGLRALTGNELGVLLCDYLLERAPRDGKNAIVTTIVSTPLAARIAAAHDARCAITLTGFKWIVQRARQLTHEGLRCVLGFEEALGYCIGGLVRDKDGIAGAAHVARMAEWHALQGRSLQDALDGLYRRHGLFDSRQLSLALETPAAVAALSGKLLALRQAPPSQIAGLRVTGSRDLLYAAPAELPQSDVFGFELDGAHRITIRPSGTEPKLKIYLDCSRQLTAAEPLAAARAQLHQLAQRILDALRAVLLA